MKSNQETLFCDECKSEIKSDYVQLPQGDLDNHGIWFGHIGEYLRFHDETFCSWVCFLKFVENWYKRAEHRVQADDAKRPLTGRNGKPTNVLADGTVLESPAANASRWAASPSKE